MPRSPLVARRGSTRALLIASAVMAVAAIGILVAVVQLRRDREESVRDPRSDETGAMPAPRDGADWLATPPVPARPPVAPAPSAPEWSEDAGRPDSTPAPFSDSQDPGAAEPSAGGAVGGSAAGPVGSGSLFVRARSALESAMQDLRAATNARWTSREEQVRARASVRASCERLFDVAFEQTVEIVLKEAKLVDSATPGIPQNDAFIVVSGDGRRDGVEYNLEHLKEWKAYLEVLQRARNEIDNSALDWKLTLNLTEGWDRCHELWIQEFQDKKDKQRALQVINRCNVKSWLTGSALESEIRKTGEQIEKLQRPGGGA